MKIIEIDWNYWYAYWRKEDSPEQVFKAMLSNFPDLYYTADLKQLEQQIKEWVDKRQTARKIIEDNKKKERERLIEERKQEKLKEEGDFIKEYIELCTKHNKFVDEFSEIAHLDGTMWYKYNWEQFEIYIV